MAFWNKKNDPEDIHSSAVEAFENGNLPAAIKLFNQVIDLAPNSERYYYRGVLYDISGDAQKAVADLSKAAELDRDNWQAHYSLALVHYKSQDYASALNAVSRAHEVAPDDPFIVNLLATLLLNSPIESHRDPARALELAKHACDLTAGQDEICLATYQRALKAAGEFAEAETINAELADLKTEDLTFELIDFFEKKLGCKADELALQNILPAPVPIAVQTIAAAADSDRSLAFTTGMSSVVMKGNSDQLSFAEFWMFIPASWKKGDKVDDKVWPWHLLQVLGHCGHDAREFRYSRSTQAHSFADLPGKFNGIEQFEAVLLLPGLKMPFGEFKSKSGRVVSLVAVVPIYAEEYALTQRVGVTELLNRFEKESIDLSFQPGRTNVGLD